MRIMQTLKQVKQKIKDDPKNWSVHLMDFVDDFRYYRDPRIIEEPFELNDERFDALLAATAEQFRIRKIFVLENFLSRV